MELYLQEPRAADAHKLAPYYTMRPNKTCDSGLLDTFIWKDYYQIRYAIVEEKALLLLMQNEAEYFTALPYCAQEDLPRYLDVLKTYFNTELKAPLKVYLADEEGVEALKLKENPNYLVREEPDFKDYLYLGEDLRTLAGKKLHQKRNQVNRFKRDYEGRWEYKTLTCADRKLVLEFMDRWFAQREELTSDESLQYEQNGIQEIIHECCSLSYKMGGILVDNRLEAMAIGTLNELEDMAVVSVEKGNPDIPGIYQVINQEFLLHEFPDVKLVNREDDVGIPGLRQAKMSYQPIAFERKYMVLQKDFAGFEEARADYYEAGVQE
ncbi:MAG: DUF2156 domain-containing protein [Lachnospiraceae bacterium]|nr:DUF2156 domain-containing protein [Lachnospiraceae bacterium]